MLEANRDCYCDSTFDECKCALQCDCLNVSLCIYCTCDAVVPVFVVDTDDDRPVHYVSPSSVSAN